MNILVPHSWLQEYLDTKLKPETIASQGSLHGPSFEHLEEIEGETVYDIEITTNRSDLMSIKGLARELGAILAGDQAQLRMVSAQLPGEKPQQLLPVPKVVVQTDKLNKVAAIVLDQVKNQPSPAFIQKRLLQIGQHPKNVIVDVTNYVTHEIGHPCHVFDYDKIMALGGEIRIGIAKPEQEFTTLDGATYHTKGGEVVFTNPAGEIIDLPAIMGTANTAVDDSTKRVLFWLESLDAQVVREASMNHAIRTTAAVLNEKSVDPALMEETLALGVKLLQKYADAQVASAPLIINPRPLPTPKPIKFDLKRLGNYLGVAITPVRVQQILASLGFTITIKTTTSLEVEVPSFRQHDVAIEEDLIEEVARIYGYHLLPSNTNFPQVQIAPQPGFYFEVEKKCRHFLADNGLTEVYTYSMVAETMIPTSKRAGYLVLANPLTDDRVYLRQQLLPSLHEVWQTNPLTRGQTKGIFELTKVYLPTASETKVQEVVRLAWLAPLPYRQARGVLENLLAQFYLHPSINSQGEILLGKTKIGIVQTLSAELFGWEIDVSPLGERQQTYPLLQPLSNKPIYTEELTFVIAAGKPVGELMEKMRQVTPNLIKLELLESYQDHYSFRCVYRDNRAALDRTQVAPWRQQIVTLMSQAGCDLVGNLPA